MIRYCESELAPGTYVIEDWPWFDILLCKVLNWLANRLGRFISRKVGDWFSRNIHIPIAKWQDVRRYMVILDPATKSFEHMKGQKVWNPS